MRCVYYALIGMAMTAPAHAKVPIAPRVIVLDDGEKLAMDAMHPLPPTPWPIDAKSVELFALRDETVALQLAIEPDGQVFERVHATVDPFSPDLGEHSQVLAQRFIDIRNPSYNEREPGSLAFTPEAAPARGTFIGLFADPLVPGPTRAGPSFRGALWIDIHVPQAARAGDYFSFIRVYMNDRIFFDRHVHLHVADATMPYPGAAITTFYDRATLTKRMGDLRAERSLRQTLHAHRLSAIRKITAVEDIAAEEDALAGKLYTGSAGYVGPGAGVGEGIMAIGSYGQLGEPDPGKAAEVGRIAERVRSVAAGTEMFVYAVDEDCKSERGARWMQFLKGVPSAQGVRVGVTCGEDPHGQASDLIMMTSDRYEPAKAFRARAEGKWVWVYNGQRPYAGATVLDVPATDLRANAWIAARYGVARWFYWESTFWLDGNKGGRGGADGFDPFAVAETFHNAHGDHANGDGILVYPGTQIVPGMINDERPEVFTSIRLKNLRRGAQDAGYVQLARAIDPDTTDAILEDRIPRALADAEGPPSWPERGRAWLDARAELLRVIERTHTPRKPRARIADRAARSSVSLSIIAGIAGVLALVVLIVRVVYARRTRSM